MEALVKRQSIRHELRAEGLAVAPDVDLAAGGQKASRAPEQPQPGVVDVGRPRPAGDIPLHLVERIGGVLVAGHRPRGERDALRAGDAGLDHQAPPLAVRGRALPDDAGRVAERERARARKRRVGRARLLLAEDYAGGAGAVADRERHALRDRQVRAVVDEQPLHLPVRLHGVGPRRGRGRRVGDVVRPRLRKRLHERVVRADGLQARLRVVFREAERRAVGRPVAHHEARVDAPLRISGIRPEEQLPGGAVRRREGPVRDNGRAARRKRERRSGQVHAVRQRELPRARAHVQRTAQRPLRARLDDAARQLQRHVVARQNPPLRRRRPGEKKAVRRLEGREVLDRARHVDRPRPALGERVVARPPQRQRKLLRLAPRVVHRRRRLRAHVV